jgi:hypothetical protein
LPLPPESLITDTTGRLTPSLPLPPESLITDTTGRLTPSLPLPPESLITDTTIDIRITTLHVSGKYRKIKIVETV